MTEAEAKKIAEAFAANNAECPFGEIVRVMLLVDLGEKVERISPENASKYLGKKEWSISFDLMDSQMIPKSMTVVVDDATGIARFFQRI